MGKRESCRRISLGGCVLVLTLASGLRAQSPEFRGLWVEVWHEGFKSASEIDALVARAVEGHYNTIIAEVLAYHDNLTLCHGAYWNSSIVPKANDIVGGIDPLAYLVEQAHASGIQVHVWLIAFRACLVWPPSGNPTMQAHPEWITTTQANMGGGPSTIDGWYTLDVGSPDVQNYLIGIVQELVSHYAIDGVVWDRIRYAQADAGYPASTSYTRSGLARFQAITGYSGTPAPTEPLWNDFRRREVTELIRRVRAETAVITSNPRQPVRHSAMLITTGDAPPDFTATSAWWRFFQNWEEWTRMGFLDTAMPMTYYDEEVHPDWYRHWVDKELIWRHQRHLVVGVDLGMNTFANSVVQMQYARSGGAEGIDTNHYYWTKEPEVNDWSWYPYVATNFFAAAAAVPSMSWRNPVMATEGTLWGQVRDGVTNLPIDDACVRVDSLEAVRTDGNGYYVVTMIPSDESGTNHKVTASKPGYPARIQSSVQMVAGEIRRGDLALGGSEVLAPVITQEPLPRTRSPGGIAAFSVAAVGQESLSYQWQKNELDLNEGGHYSGVETTVLTVSDIDVEVVANYRCAVTNAGGTTFTSPAALTLTGTPGLEFMVESREGGANRANYAEVGLCYDSTTKSTATGTTAGIGTRWASMNRDASGPANEIFCLTPASTGLYEIFITWPSSTNASSHVGCVVTHACGSAALVLDQCRTTNPGGGNNWNSLGQHCLSGATNYTVTLSNENAPDPGYVLRADAVKWRLIHQIDAPIITQQPQARYVCPGKITTFTVSATAEGTLTYQWQKNGTNLTDAGHYSGVTTPTLLISDSDNSDAAHYRCVVTADCITVISNAPAMTLRTVLPIDFDCDCDVDAEDVGAFAVCSSGSAIHYAGTCAQSDLDGDTDVDQDDFGIFQRCFSGENNPPPPDCAD